MQMLFLLPQPCEYVLLAGSPAEYYILVKYETNKNEFHVSDAGCANCQWAQLSRDIMAPEVRAAMSMT